MFGLSTEQQKPKERVDLLSEFRSSYYDMRKKVENIQKYGGKNNSNFKKAYKQRRTFTNLKKVEVDHLLGNLPPLHRQSSRTTNQSFKKMSYNLSSKISNQIGHDISAQNFFPLDQVSEEMGLEQTEN